MAKRYHLQIISYHIFGSLFCTFATVSFRTVCNSDKLQTLGTFRLRPCTPRPQLDKRINVQVVVVLVSNQRTIFVPLVVPDIYLGESYII